MNRKMNRRKALEYAGLGFGSIVSASLGKSTFLTSLSLANSSGKQTVESKIRSSEADPEQWKYLPIDPLETAENAYQLYSEGSCMYAAFRSIVEAVGKKWLETDPQLAEIYLKFPFFMMKYGKGGVRDFGSLCGILNGCAATIGLFVHSTDVQTEMISELFYYYEHENLPIYQPQSSPFSSLPQTDAQSVLCHISATRWSKIADYEINSPQKKERCKRLTCDLVLKTIKLLDRYFASLSDEIKCVFRSTPDEETSNCLKCHSDSGDQKDVTAQMNCSNCHYDLTDEHPQ